MTSSWRPAHAYLNNKTLQIPSSYLDEVLLWQHWKEYQPILCIKPSGVFLNVLNLHALTDKNASVVHGICTGSGSGHSDTHLFECECERLSVSICQRWDWLATSPENTTHIVLTLTNVSWVSLKHPWTCPRISRIKDRWMTTSKYCRPTISTYK